MNDKNVNAKAPEFHRIIPVVLKVENLHIHLDERSTSNTYFHGSDEPEKENAKIDIDAMLDNICTKTGLCKESVLLMLDAQAEYLDSVYGKDDKAADEDEEDEDE